MDGIVGTNRLKEDFDMTTTHFILVDEGLSNHEMTQLTKELEQVDGVHQVMSYEKFLGGGKMCIRDRFWKSTVFFWRRNAVSI